MTATYSLPMGALRWTMSGHVGLSSEAIFAHMTLGVAPAFGGRREWHWPRDPDDLGRCRRLLDAVPEWKERLGEMATHGPEWAALVGSWDGLCLLMDEEVPAWRDKRGGTAPKTYALMKELIRG